MQVRDLIYLLQTRAKPEDSIMLSISRIRKDKRIEHGFVEWEAEDFSAVYKSDEHSMEDVCFIDLGSIAANSIARMFNDGETLDESAL